MFSSEHRGFVEKRRWFYVLWLKNPPNMAIKGKTDLIMDEDMEKYRPYVEIIREYNVPKCNFFPYRRGKAGKEEIEKWLKENASL